MYYDYRFKFPATGISQALQALAALRAAGLLGTADIPDNMLGDPRDSNGNMAASGVDSNGNMVASGVAFVGRRGFAAASYVDENGQTVTVPARGDPAWYYIHIRSELVAPDQIPFDPASFGLVPTLTKESAAVLGVWAGDLI